MSDFLPTLFIVLGAAALVLMLYCLWQSLRQALAHPEQLPAAGVAPGTRARTQLLAEKKALLLALKDLEAERDSGKLSEPDYTELNARYRARAREVLKALDLQLAPHREAARAMLQGGTSAATAPAGAEAPPASAPTPAEPAELAPAASAAPETAPAVGTRGCASCTAKNDVDAVFCKRCGARLAVEAPA